MYFCIEIVIHAVIFTILYYTIANGVTHTHMHPSTHNIHICTHTHNTQIKLLWNCFSLNNTDAFGGPHYVGHSTPESR